MYLKFLAEICGAHFPQNSVPQAGVRPSVLFVIVLLIAEHLVARSTLSASESTAPFILSIPLYKLALVIVNTASNRLRMIAPGSSPQCAMKAIVEREGHLLNLELDRACEIINRTEDLSDSGIFHVTKLPRPSIEATKNVRQLTSNSDGGCVSLIVEISALSSEFDHSIHH